LIIQEYIITVLSQILIYGECCIEIRPAVTDENGLFDATRHVSLLSLVAVRGLYRNSKRP
jgi:hypothetical protein